jgi:hypothetical protein
MPLSGDISQDDEKPRATKGTLVRHAERPPSSQKRFLNKVVSVRGDDILPSRLIEATTVVLHKALENFALTGHPDALYLRE